MAEIRLQPVTDKLPGIIPDDVLIEIFLKLPGRSLFLFRSVCKHWLHLIESSYFIRLHLNCSTKSPILIVHATNTESNPKTYNITLLFDHETLPYKYDLPFLSLRGSQVFEGLNSHQLLGPCNGIFGISDINDTLLFNPTTRECMYVPDPYFIPNGMPKCCSDITDYHRNIGFGFDPVSDDYKVVRLLERSNFEHGYKDETSYHRHYNFEIFSLSTGEWNEVDHVLQGEEFCRIGSDFLFCNNAFHWVAGEDDGYRSIPRWIIAFDLSKESLRHFELPDIEDACWVSLLIVNESLAILNPDLGERTSNAGEKIPIWVMKEYGVYKSWSKLYNIDFNIRIPLSFGKGGELLFSNSSSRLASINLNTGVIKEHEVDGVTHYARRYRESLVSLKRPEREESESEPNSYCSFSNFMVILLCVCFIRLIVPIPLSM